MKFIEQFMEFVAIVSHECRKINRALNGTGAVSVNSTPRKSISAGMNEQLVLVDSANIQLPRADS